MKLKKKTVSKPWGRKILPDHFGGTQKDKIGEIWFEPPTGITPRLMIKYLFTSEKLSIQVHPNDRQARRAGHPHGKEECWYILDADPGATLGLGLTKEVSPTKLQAAVVLGQMEHLIDWKPVKAGDFFYVPAGTIHAIGPGITLVEVQQNVDLTYRIYDYGRPREVHLEDAMKVSKLAPYDMKYANETVEDKTIQLVDGPCFKLFQIIGDDHEIIADIAASEWQVLPLEGTVKARKKIVRPGECGLATDAIDIDLSQNKRSLIACSMD